MPKSPDTLRSVITTWRAQGSDDDWWREATGIDGEIYDINIYDARIHGAERPATGHVYCVYPTRATGNGMRETDVFRILARGTV